MLTKTPPKPINNVQSQKQVIQSLPPHLQPFVAIQHYPLYTPRDHAVWRFLIHQLTFSLQGVAHKTYFEGLTKTGISFEAIPRIENINQCLSKLGWRAVAVDGFLPPAVFMEFQAIRVLAIAVNIRSFKHMLYTPAPDIIHESAGHAPFLIDIDYAEFLQRFGELGMRSIANQHDLDHYEAVRTLSIIKENVDSSAEQISHAQHTVEKLQNKKNNPSEATLLARLHWWTVEYGLVGDVGDYTIFGAGLLSSLSESQSCLNDDKISKKVLTINSIDTSYDITAQQPQLFITQSCRHLSHVLEEYGRHMCCNVGGAAALLKAHKAGSIVTVTMNSGLQVSGKIDQILYDSVGNSTYMKTSGPTQLALNNIELEGHGTEKHAEGFGSPIGRLIGLERCLSLYSVDELKRHGICINEKITLRFLSGITVHGRLTNILRHNQKNILLSIDECTVKNVDETILFDPSWGSFDMAVGDSVISVSGGSADQHRYPIYDTPSLSSKTITKHGEHERVMFKLYSDLRTHRDGKNNPDAVIENILALENADWLLYFEALELTISQKTKKNLQTKLIQKLATETGDSKILITHGLSRLNEL